MFMLYIVLTCRIINFSLYNLIMILDEKNMELTGLRMHISYVSVSHLGMLFSWKESSATIQVRPQKLFFCFFSQAPAHSFFYPRFKIFIQRIVPLISSNLILFLKKSDAKKMSLPSHSFFQKSAWETEDQFFLAECLEFHISMVLWKSVLRTLFRKNVYFSFLIHVSLDWI